MAHDGRQPCLFHHVAVVVEEPSHGAHAHGRAVSATVGGLWVVALYPAQEALAVASHGVGVASAPFVERLLVRSMAHDGVGNGDGTDGIIGVTAVRGEESKFVIGLFCKLKT